MQNEHKKINEAPEDSLNLKEEALKYVVHWKWFLVSIFFFLSIAYISLRYATPIYKSKTTILLKDEGNSSIVDQLSGLSGVGMLSGTNSNVDNEIETIKSRSLVEQAIKRLSLNIKYYIKGRVKDGELYDNLPFVAFFSEYTDDFNGLYASYFVKKSKSGSFSLYDGNDNLLGSYQYGQTISLSNCKLVLIKKNQDSWNDDSSVEIKIVPVSSQVDSFSSRLVVTPLNRNTSTLELSITDASKKLAEDFLNTLVEVYNEDAIKDNNYISKSTSEFIDQRLVLLTEELDDVETEEETFKTRNKITSIGGEGGMDFSADFSENEKELVANEMQIKILKILSDNVSRSDKGLLPVDVITSESGANTTISQYNQLILKRNNYLDIGGGPQNPKVKEIDNQLTELMPSIKESFNSYKRTLEFKNKELRKQIALIEGKIAKVPSQEKEFRGIARQQGIKEALYLLLLQKREEMAIALAIKPLSAKTIDKAITLPQPVSPNRQYTYLGAFALGLLLPFGVIFLGNLLDNKIKSRLDIEKNSSIPFLGDLPKSTSSDQIIKASSRTSTAEALRIIRTNIEFLFSGVAKNSAKTIFVTSTFPKEGKTFVSVNLAGTIALSGKKVLLIGMDIRNPKIDEYLSVPSSGLTNYITSTTKDISSFIIKHPDFEQFYILPSGVIPPNPAELLMNQRVDEMLDTLKKEYDYIVVDTAPVGLVTDTFVVAKHADCFLYVVRANMLEKQMLRIANELYNEKKLPNMAIILNDTETNNNFGYGYGYGYGSEVNAQSTSVLQNILKKIKRT